MASTKWTAVVRTIVQTVIGLAVASVVGQRVVDWLGNVGIPVNEDVLVSAVTTLLIGAVVWTVNTLGVKFPWINKIVSLGLSRTGPAYVPNAADAVISTANADSDDTVRIVDLPPPGPNN